MFLFAFVAMIAMGASAQMNVWENGGLSAQYAIESVDSVTFGITSETPSSGTGKDGITPLLKIENDYWYVSYDEGQTWQQEGRATGEDGDSMFQSVTQDENYVYFTLADGTVIKIAKGNGQNEQPNEDDIIDFEDINVLIALINAGVDIDNDGYISYGEVANVDSLVLANNQSIAFFREFQYFTNIKYFSFSTCKQLVTIILPETLKSISAYAFNRCENLKYLHIPESCTKIEEYAFYYCVNLIEISLPSKLKRIEKRTFSGCSALKSLDIPNSVNYIASKYAIDGLTINTLTLPEEYSADALGELGNPNLTTIVWNSISYPSNYVYKGTYSYYGLGAWYSSHSGSRCSNGEITTIIFGEKVESLPKYLCYCMSSLKTLYSKNTVPPILSTNTFVDCNNIQHVYVPTESVEEYKTQWSLFADKIVGYDFE